MNRMIFRSFRKRNSSQKNTNIVYSEYSYSGIVQKERALREKNILFPTVLKSLEQFEEFFSTLQNKSLSFCLTIHVTTIGTIPVGPVVQALQSFLMTPAGKYVHGSKFEF